MAITFGHLFTFTNSSPATSGAFTPSAANDLIMIMAQDGAGANTPVFTGTGGGSWSNAGSTIALPAAHISVGVNTTEAAGSQTATITATGGAFRCWGWDYIGVATVGTPVATQTITPGTGAGAIIGTAVVVPVGSVLVVLCIDTSAGTPAITATGGTSRGSSSVGAQAYLGYEFAGAGASITPTFTSAGGATDTFNIVQVLLSPGGASNAAAVAWTA